MPADIRVVELRQYTLRGGRRDELISLFSREFITPQEAVGAHVLGLFRDLDDPDRFVWIRGFEDMARRKAALEAFYGGPVWAAHRTAANATILDSDNVLLLEPLAGSERVLRPMAALRPGVVRVAICSLPGVDPRAFARVFDQILRPRIAEAGGDVLAGLVSETSRNDFRLPVRENDPVFVWVSRFVDADAERVFTERLHRASGWRDGVADAMLPAFMRKPEVLRLAPTSRSPLR